MKEHRVAKDPLFKLKQKKYVSSTGVEPAYFAVSILFIFLYGGLWCFRIWILVEYQVALIKIKIELVI